ncbi:MAG: response regulator transcription factor [Calditrichae bacterium]|nr:response regulator transcription factor [Calditrichia bacterium]
MMATEFHTRVMIVDDEPWARALLRRLLSAEPDMEIVAEAGDGREALALLRKDPPDLLFLDIQMPEMNGFEVVAALPPEMLPRIIFVTAYDQYALQAFEVHALDYLLKPVRRERFAAALERARLERRNSDIAPLNANVQRLLESLQVPPRYLKRLAIPRQERIFFLAVDEIDWIESAEKYLRLHSGGQTYLLRESLSNLEAALDPEKFLRIHRSRMVNLERIREIHPWFNGEFQVVLENGQALISGRTYRERLRDLCKRGF